MHAKHVFQLRVHPPTKLAFSLVELSIVLVILGLLVGGVLSGQSLIRAAELRSVVTDINTINSALNSFRDKYFALPGDLTNATSFWGIAGGSTGNDDSCYTVASTDQRTCNGNGNGQIDGAYSAVVLAERARLWQHLANAGMIEGTYNGYQPNDITIGGVNAKRGKISAGTNWTIAYVGTVSGSDVRFYDGVNANILELTTDRPVANTETMRTLMTPAELWNLDTKIDDGLPASGVLRGPKNGYPNDPNCTTSSTPAAYDLQRTDKACFPTLLLR